MYACLLPPNWQRRAPRSKDTITNIEVSLTPTPEPSGVLLSRPLSRSSLFVFHTAGRESSFFLIIIWNIHWRDLVSCHLWFLNFWIAGFVVVIECDKEDACLTFCFLYYCWRAQQFAISSCSDSCDTWWQPFIGQFVLGKIQQEQQATLRLHFTRFLFFLGKHIDAVYFVLVFFLLWCSLVTENPQAVLLIFLVSAFYTIVCLLFKNSLISLNTT